MVLHTWGQNLSQHLHVHCVVSGGALAPDGRWIPAKRGFLFPVRALSVVFRAKYLEALEGAFEAGQLDFAGETTPLAEPSAFPAFLAKLRAKDWVVYAKPPFGGPERCSPTSGAIPTGSPSATSASWMRKRGGPLPLQGLCPREQDQGDALTRRGIHPSVSPPCPPQGLHADPALWPPRQSPPHRAPGRLPGRARCADASACRTRNGRGLPLSGARSRCQPLPALW